MSYYQGGDHHNDPQAPAWGFVAYVVVITAIAGAMVWLQILLQNPK